MKIGIVGLGLIGGSLAKTIKQRTKHTVLACDISEKEMQRAELTDAIDMRLDDKNLAECDIVLIAIYPRDVIDYIGSKANCFKDNALVVDCAGVKRSIAQKLHALTENTKWHFIGGHPMAGREYSGFSHAQDDLFENASMILTPGESISIELRQTAKDFFLSLGFGRVMFASPETHDEIIAYTSQLAHIISNAYIRSELAMKHRGFSANSFQDMTRVARLNTGMWTELFIENSDYLASELDGLIARITEIRDAIAGENKELLTSLLKEGNDRKELLDN